MTPTTISAEQARAPLDRGIVGSGTVSKSA